MQTLEATISFLFFVWAASMMLASFEPQKTDHSLYRLQLVEDAWRVLYLRGNFEDFNEQKEDDLEKEFQEITRQTSLCLFMDGVRITSCRGGEGLHEITASVTRTVIYEGKPKTFTFSAGTSHD